MPATETAVPLRDPMVHDLHLRVSDLEKIASQDMVELAVIKKDLEYVKGSVNKITAGINRILWAIALSVVAAATTFVLSGGFVIVQQ